MQFARQRRTLLIDSVAQLLILQQRLLGKLAQAFARFCQRHGAVIAQKQRMADIFFKPLDLA